MGIGDQVVVPERVGRGTALGRDDGVVAAVLDPHQRGLADLSGPGAPAGQDHHRHALAGWFPWSHRSPRTRRPGSGPIRLCSVRIHHREACPSANTWRRIHSARWTVALAGGGGGPGGPAVVDWALFAAFHRYAYIDVIWKLIRGLAPDGRHDTATHRQGRDHAGRIDQQCGREDSNLHPRRDRDLNPARLPIPPRPQQAKPTEWHRPILGTPARRPCTVTEGHRGPGYSHPVPPAQPSTPSVAPSGPDTAPEPRRVGCRRPGRVPDRGDGRHRRRGQAPPGLGRPSGRARTGAGRAVPGVLAGRPAGQGPPPRDPGPGGRVGLRRHGRPRRVPEGGGQLRQAAHPQVDRAGTSASSSTRSSSSPGRCRGCSTSSWPTSRTSRQRWRRSGRRSCRRARSRPADPGAPWWSAGAVAALTGVAGRVLHADCGNGSLVEALIAAGVDAYGVDPAEVGDRVRRRAGPRRPGRVGARPSRRGRRRGARRAWC